MKIPVGIPPTPASTAASRPLPMMVISSLMVDSCLESQSITRMTGKTGGCITGFWRSLSLKSDLSSTNQAENTIPTQSAIPACSANTSPFSSAFARTPAA